MPDGVFTPQDDGTLGFVALPPPAAADIETLVRRIGRRISKRLRADEAAELCDEAMVEQRVEAVGLPIPAAVRSELAPQEPLCAAVDGFSLHADLAAPQHDEKRWQRLLRYGLRPPLSQRRLSWTADGKVRLALRRPSATGRTSIVFEPVDFLRRLAAAIPRPRQNLIRFHGCFAANHKRRPEVVALSPGAKRRRTPDGQPITDAAGLTVAHHGPDPIGLNTDRAGSVPRPYRRRWAELLKHIFDHDVLVCDRCSGRMVPVQTVDSPVVITGPAGPKRHAATCAKHPEPRRAARQWAHPHSPRAACYAAATTPRPCASPADCLGVRRRFRLHRLEALP